MILVGWTFKYDINKNVGSDFLLKHMEQSIVGQLTLPNLNISRINILNNLPSIVNQLTFIDLSNNDITAIPTLKLINLETLILDNNKVRFLEGLKQLSNLKKLSLKNNRLERIPTALVSATVTEVNLEGNPVQEDESSMLQAFPSRAKQ